MKNAEKLKLALSQLADSPPFVAKMPPVLSEQDKLYLEYLQKATNEDFTSIEASRAIYVPGVDTNNRPIVVIVAEKVKNIDIDKLFLYIICISYTNLLC